MALRFLHLADLDLGARHHYPEDGAEEREREVQETFRDAISFALDPERRIDGILIAGNLFDRHRPEPQLWGFVRGLLGRVAAARKPVILVPGCRDGLGYRDSVYRTERLPGVDVITAPRPGEPLRLEIGGQTAFFYGVAAQPGLTPSPFPGFQRSEEEGLHVGLLCGAIPDHPEWEIRPHDLVIHPDALADSGLDYVALGGYHQRTVLDLEGTTAAYCGTLEGRDFRHGGLGRKGLTVVEISADDAVLEHHPISRRRIEEWSLDLGAEAIHDAESLVCALMGRSDPDVIARVILSGAPEFLCDVEEVSDRVRERFHHLEIVDRTDLLGSGLLRRIRNEHTIRGFFVRRMLERIDELEEGARSASPDAAVYRQLEVARRALKLGLEQFLEEEAASEVLYPATEPSPGATRDATETAETHEGAAATSRNNGRPAPTGPPERVKALLKRDREMAGPALAEGEESA